MDLLINDNDIDIESIIEEVIDKSFEAIEVSDLDNFHDEPATNGKNMDRLRKWYQRTSAEEWRSHYAQKDCHQMNPDAEGESDDSLWRASECDDDENEGTDTEMATDDDEIYCLCRRPYNNEAMVGCDGVGCKYEWFHFACVGLPLSWSSEEDWLCPECRES